MAEEEEGDERREQKQETQKKPQRQVAADSSATLAGVAVRQRARQLKQDFKRTTAGRTVTKVKWKATRVATRTRTFLTQGGSY